MVFNAKIQKDGGLDFESKYNLGRFRQWCKDNPGKEIRIEGVIRSRSKSQNALYWLYLEVIERETGNTANDLHEYFKRVFLAPKWIKVLDKEIKIPRSTTDLNKIQFGEYMEKICAETGVPIPDVEEYKKKRDDAPMLKD